MAQAVERTARRLEELGHDVVPLAGGLPDTTAAFVPQFLHALRTAAAGAEHPERLERRTRQTARMGWVVSDRALVRARAAGDRLRQRFLEQAAGPDAVLTPTLVCLPPTVGQLDAAGSLQALRRSVPMAAFTVLASATGLPAVSVPGAVVDGQPVGVQLLGTSPDEGTLLALADQLMR